MDMDIEHWRSEVNNFYLLHHQVFILTQCRNLVSRKGFLLLNLLACSHSLVFIFASQFSKNLIYKISFKKQTFVFK